MSSSNNNIGNHHHHHSNSNSHHNHTPSNSQERRPSVTLSFDQSNEGLGLPKPARMRSGTRTEDENEDPNLVTESNSDTEEPEHENQVFPFTTPRRLKRAQSVGEWDPTVLPPPRDAPWGQWTSDDTSKLVIRGKTFLHDKKKIPCGRPMYRLVHVDMFYASKDRIPHVASRPDSYAYQYHQKWMEERGLTENDVIPVDENSPAFLSPMIIINFLFPGPEGRDYNLVLYMIRRVPPFAVLEDRTKAHNEKRKKKQVHHSSNSHPHHTEDSPREGEYNPHPNIDLARLKAFDRVLYNFLTSADDDRDNRLKIIPRIADGPWLVKRGVGCTPAILGRKIKQTYYRDPIKNYIEIDSDVGSSALAGKILSLVKSAATSLIIELTFLLQGEDEEELPESLLAGVRIIHPDLNTTVSVEENATRNNTVFSV